ncbi:MAG: hypothetical protein M1322_00010 [Candidatus Parvarchaeota archaeon]|jgi:hypothetical protein|nr:hypothetical protein [Candidatus Parvarchaeota archaeon]MCL5106498.1 hypothetical protein [Candidatus Parvarchaeota archaeon]
MKGQFSFEFVIDIAFVLILIAFIAVFFAHVSAGNPTVSNMNGICYEIADSINSIAASNGLQTIQYLPLLTFTRLENYTINVSNGIIIIYESSLYGGKLLAGQDLTSCGANTMLTENESFGLSNLALYTNSTDIALAYEYANYSDNLPDYIFVGGFTGRVNLSLDFSNGTTATLAVQNAPFTYFANTKSIALPAGIYNYVAESVSNPKIYVDLPFSIG